MAIGIFGLAALQQIPDMARYATAPLAMALLVLWAWIAAAFLRITLAGQMRIHVRPPVGRFAIGTWVAGTAVLARMIQLALPNWTALTCLLGSIAILLWLWFVPLVVSGFRTVAANPGGHRPSGVILLSAVSTQSVALVLLDLPAPPPTLQALTIALIVLGYVLYAVGATLILRRYLGQLNWRLADDWENPNCILHGAMSISGLAAVVSGSVPFAVCYGTWLYVVAAFVLVEALEFVRLTQRLRLYGWRRGIMIYHVSQWSRNFTFGMFYAFTLAFERAFPALPNAVEAVRGGIVAYGPYLVLLFLVVEVGLFLSGAWRGRNGRPAACSEPFA